MLREENRPDIIDKDIKIMKNLHKKVEREFNRKITQIKFEKINTEYDQLVIRGKKIIVNNNIDDEIEKFICDPPMKKRFGENDIGAQIRHYNTYRSDVREEMQAILDEQEITMTYQKYYSIFVNWTLKNIRISAESGQE